MAEAGVLLLDSGTGGICNLHSPRRDKFLNLIQDHAWWSLWRKSNPGVSDPQTLGGQGRQQCSDLGTQQRADNSSPEVTAQTVLLSSVFMTSNQC